MASPVLQTVPLGPRWPTIDPFLFCAHHDDAYPPGNACLGPDAPLSGRDLGMDFSNADGWSMYHGLVVPGFPQHPHRGFETVTYVRRGLIDHSDSLGAAARYGGGDVQWLTAGRGIVHAEMFPLLDGAGPNPTELFQIWLNLPSDDKFVDPHFTMLWQADIPHLVVTDDDGRVTDITVVAGDLGGVAPLAPPPHSWASRADSDIAIWHIRADAQARWVMPPAAGPDTVRVVYVFTGSGLWIGGVEVMAPTAAVVRADEALTVEADADGSVEALVLQGRPIGEPVAQYGPFVMNDDAGIRQAFADYRETEFGGWPWDDDAPTHGPAHTRFARHADGRVDEAQPVSL